MSCFLNMTYGIFWLKTASGLILNHRLPLLFIAPNFGAARVYVLFVLYYTIGIYFWISAIYCTMSYKRSLPLARPPVSLNIFDSLWEKCQISIRLKFIATETLTALAK